VCLWYSRILCASRSSSAAKLWGSGAFFLPPQPGMYYPVSIVMIVLVLPSASRLYPVNMLFCSLLDSY